MTLLQGRNERAAGFTLLELLVAMAIFAIVGVLAMGGLNAVLSERELAVKQLERLHQVQRAVRVVTNDFSQLNPRHVRDILGEGGPSLDPLKSDCDVGVIVCLSRAGWTNPFYTRPRGELQRVQYRVEDGKVIREYWPAMDRILVTEPHSEVLLEDVVRFEVDYESNLQPANGPLASAAAGAQWVQQWPPEDKQELPQAVRISLTLKDWGDIERYVEVPG